MQFSVDFFSIRHSVLIRIVWVFTDTIIHIMRGSPVVSVSVGLCSRGGVRSEKKSNSMNNI